MMLLPPIDTLTQKAGNKYRLCILLGKQAKFLKKNVPGIDFSSVKEISAAANQFANDEIGIDEN